MTPQKCLETRLRLGWTRNDLAAAAGLAAPIVRLYEAGALDGFEACGEALARALGEAGAPALQVRRVAKPSHGAGVAANWSAAHWGQAAFAN